jgi:phospholipid N-methyltransferase
MSFSSDWLRLREPADLRARNRVLVGQLATMFVGRRAPAVVDLGAGTGASVRALDSHLPEGTSWRLVDSDKKLLKKAAKTLPEAQVETRVLDIDADLETTLETPVDLVTCSALLDLVSETWMKRLVEVLSERQLPVYAALTYDGTVIMSPSDPLDAAITEAVNQHQHMDKGFGPALGPDAPLVAIELLRQAGFTIENGRSDWVLEPDEQPLQAALVAGWIAAAREVGLLAPADIDHWEKARLDAIEAGELTIRVGHIDLLARP